MITIPIRRRRRRIAGLSMRALPLLATSLLSLRPAGLQAQAPRAGSAALVRQLATELRRTAGLPGLSVAIGQGGRIVFAEGFGFADVEARRPVTPATRFRTGSVAKVITATALARLVESGTMDLDAPVQRYVPSFPAAAAITPRQLAGHVAGIAHYTSGDRIEARFYPTVADALGVFSHVAPVAPPGERYNYSTHGYTLLAAAIEGAAGRPFLEQVEQSVLRPLGMRSTGPELHTAPSRDDAVLYSLSDSGPVRVTAPEDPSYKWAGGGMRSSPSDLVRMAGAYTSGFLRPATVASMFESQRLTSGARTGVGIGWRNSFDMGGRRVVEHAGFMQGARSVVALFPDDGVAVSLMANAEWSSSIEETAHLIALAYLQKPAPRPQPVGRYSVTAASVNGRGDTTSLSGSMTLRRGGGTLELAPPAGRARSTFPLVYLERGNVYALVRPDGLYHLTLTAAGDSVAGQAVGYGSPRSDSPASNPPFFRLQGRRAR